jgi:hypothetical protein
MSDRYARLLELPDRPLAGWTRTPEAGELFRDGTDVYMGDGVTAATGLTPINGGGPGGGAPTNASYVVLGLNGSLSAERVLTAGTGIDITDAGANGNVTVALESADNLSTILDGATDPFLRTSAAGGGATWGSITGTLSSQTDLQTALDAKLNHAQVMRRNVFAGPF